MKKKGKILLGVYLCAALAALSFWAWTGHRGLADYRLAAEYSSGRAFEETLRSVKALSGALDKSVYAAGGSMCERLCSEAYANALAAETALATLPFSTEELEQLSGFLNVAGDYAYTLAYEAAEEGFTEEQLKNLTDMAETASGFAGLLEQLQGGLGDGSVVMDSREVRLDNVDGQAEGTEMLSARLLAYEESFQPLAELHYDGLYGAEKKETRWTYTQDEMKRLAAEYAGVQPEELELRYEYEGDEGRVCYAAGDTLLCVSPAGVESMAQSRLVGDDLISDDEALEAAERFLTERGFEGLELLDSRISGAVALFRFAGTEGDAVCLDDWLSVAIALDDGSVYSFNASEYDPTPTGAEWTLTAEEAAEKLPKGLKLLESRKVLLRSAGEQDLPCYELRCAGGERQVLLYVDAADGRQRRIELSPRSEKA